MARIVKVGPADPNWKDSFRCTNCWGTVEVSRSDLRVRQSKGIGCGSSAMAHVLFDCPLCRQPSEIDKCEWYASDSSKWALAGRKTSSKSGKNPTWCGLPATLDTFVNDDD